jgi:hypothetical protein
VEVTDVDGVGAVAVVVDGVGGRGVPSQTSSKMSTSRPPVPLLPTSTTWHRRHRCRRRFVSTAGNVVGNVVVAALCQQIRLLETLSSSSILTMTISLRWRRMSTRRRRCCGHKTTRRRNDATTRRRDADDADDSDDAVVD